MKTMQIMDERLTLTESRVSSILSMQRGVHPMPVYNTSGSREDAGVIHDGGVDETLSIMRDISQQQQQQQLLGMKLSSVAWPLDRSVPSRQEQLVHGSLQNHLRSHHDMEIGSKSGSTNASHTNAVAASFMNIANDSADASFDDFGEVNVRDEDDEDEDEESDGDI